MQLRTLATVATLAFTGHALAQGCGTAQLTTPPNFVSNNGGSSGGAVYFSLSTLAGAPNGVSICGISINTSAAIGTTLDAVIYRHTSIGDWNALTTTNLAASNWCPVATATGTSAGTDVASVLTLGSPLTIAPGTQELFAIAGNFAHRYTNGTGANQTINDGNLQFDGGKASNVAFTGGLFSPRVFNGTFDYSLPSSPVASSTCGVVALCEPVGEGCGGVPGQVYEVFGAGAFDLVDTVAGTSQDILITLGGGTASLVTLPSTPIVPPVAPDLGLGDDQNTVPIPLGFALDGLCASTISVASNGYIWLGTTGAADFSESESEFVNQGARLAVYWTDLNPAAGGSIHVDANPGQVIVTYLNVFPFGGTAAAVTAQVEFTANTIRIRYDAAGGAYADSTLVGLSNGVAPAAAPGSVDLNGGSVGPVATLVDLQLFCDAEPRLGATASFRTTGIPSGWIGGTLISLGPALVPGVPLAPFACGDRHVTGVTNLGLILGACEGTLLLTLPNNPTLLGTQFALQSAAVGTAIITSNGLDCVVGNF